MNQTARVMFLPALTAFAILVSGCTPSNNTASPESSAAAESAKPTEAAGTEKVKLRMTTWSTADSYEMQKSVLDSYMKEHPSVEITFESVPDNYDQKLLAQFAISDAPDIIMVGDTHIPVFSENGGLADLSSLVDGANGVDPGDFYEDIVNYGKYKDKLYAMPKDWSNMAILYNKKLFDEAKIPYPQAGWTWDELYETAKKLTKREGGKTTQWGFKLPATDQRRVQPLVLAYSDGIVSPDGTTYNGYMNSPGVVTALQWLSDAYHKDEIMPSSTDTDSFKGIDMFGAGKVAMDFNGRWPIEDYVKDPNMEFGTVSLPVGPNGANNFVFYGGWSIYEKSEHKEAAWDVIKYMTTRGGAEVFGDFGFVAYKPVADEKGQATDINYKSFTDDIPNTKIMPDMIDVDYPKSGKPAFTEALEKILLSETDVKQVLDEAAAAADKAKK
ncbi:ABC transporter substrate-binding protein [Paenibacillus donghaensis]|uniref:ABC transporter substrate-binding protein n=1 Tax=Paenibacillus donghaensis TaxID=414771 RepID=A0A2Z2KEM4_9BACL|nr:sugar ABC transporter substrate-binding protein [Paenibacillus donghaensis]ASA21590.1 hypothetical protein B9T62_12910 [Paenibacillus donghaensis]